jgi:hypothetical protein
MTTARRWRLSGWIVAAAALTAGCNPFLAPYFLLLGVEQKEEPEFRIASKEKDKEVTVVILASNGLETRPEFLLADVEISRLLAKKLEMAFEKNKELVKIVPLARINKFKDEHPNWQAMRPSEIGEEFEADYVINLEINSLTLYKPGSANSLFHGHAAISVDVVDVHEPDDGPKYRKELTCDYPDGREIAVGDTHPQQFKLAFYHKLTTRLAWLFTAHPYDDRFNFD